MNEIFQTGAAISAGIAMLVSLPAWAVSLYYLVRTARSTIHGNAAWKLPTTFLAFLRWQPFSPVLDASQLTPQGLVYRRRFVVALLLFAVPIVVALVLAAIVR